jgi:CRP/FNR family cyclic AMP-dependent transcriptional regulator
MYLLGEQPAYADAWVTRLQAMAPRLLQGLAPAAAAIEFEQASDLGAQLDSRYLYLIEHGLVYARMNERALFYLHEGDLLGWRLDSEAPQYHLSCDAPLRLVPYAREGVLAHMAAHPEAQEALVQYLVGHSVLLCDAVTRLKQPEFRAANGFKQVGKGEVLINQGDTADHVFIIIEGHAEAFVDGQKVGEVVKDEIVGAMAVFTNERRSATVIASQPCTVMLIAREQFLSLTQNNPRIAHSLIESMARRIDTLNRQLTAATATDIRPSID